MSGFLLNQRPRNLAANKECTKEIADFYLLWQSSKELCLIGFIRYDCLDTLDLVSLKFTTIFSGIWLNSTFYVTFLLFDGNCNSCDKE